MTDENEQLIQDCEARADKLNEWEASFIQSIREQWDKRGSLSERQQTTLERIWERIT